tara:strand:+ start:214 stop:450 length:237 start_codon:yes stop_codon:yes gene_type:complete
MRKLILSVAEDKKSFEVLNNSFIYIFENVYEYEEEILDMFEKNKLSFSELESIVKSWGGKIKTITIKQLINSYYKNNT